ncbi:MAG: leucine-rich repeat domain-containing protein [Aeriscardovia sp.]|nr:leucine-rich repeat domain-containing protein [Aeriscardovia sp.]
MAPQYVGWHILTGTSWYNNQPNGLIYLGDALLMYKGTMPDNTVLSIREGTTCIGGSAFVSQKGLKNITIPSSVKSIGSAAFSNCTSLESVTIPEDIEEVGNKAFCNTPWFTSQPDGLLYIGKVAYRYKGEMPANTSFEIREGTTAIVDSAFYNCTNLTDVIIPNSVAKIGPLAFSGCSSLTNVTIPGIPTIDEKTFENCASLSELTLQEGTSIINDYAFSGCSSLVTMHWPTTLKRINNYVFNNCTSLTSMLFPEGLTSFGGCNFSGCTSISSVSFPSTLGDGFSGGSTFSGASSIREARFHSRIIPQNVGTILGNIGDNFDISKFIYYVPHGLREEYERHISWSDKILEMGEDEEIVQFADEEVKRICIANYDANLSGTVDKTELGEVHYPMIASMSYFYKQNFSENTIITSFDEFKYFTNCTTVPSRFFIACSNLSSITLPISVNYIGSANLFHVSLSMTGKNRYKFGFVVEELLQDGLLSKDFENEPQKSL